MSTGGPATTAVDARLAEKETVERPRAPRELSASGHISDFTITPNSHGLYPRLRELEEAQVEQRRKELAVARALTNV